MKNIVIIGGGTGTSTLLSGLRRFYTNNAVIVSTADDGGSTGKLREDLGALPPGDIRHCLIGLSHSDSITKSLFSYRFKQGFLKGHVVGNILLVALEKITGSIEAAIAESAKLLNVRGEVVPVTLFPTRLSAILENGKKITGEHNIDEPKQNQESRIKNLVLKPSQPANPRAIRLISEADVIVFGPGDPFTSTIPNLLVRGIAQAIRKAKAQKILVTNLMTKHGQTDKFKASDHAWALEKYLGKGMLDCVIVNTKRPSSYWMRRHKKEHSEYVEPDLAVLKKLKLKVIARPLLSQNTSAKNSSDPLKRSFLRHDSLTLAKIIYELA